MTDSSAKPTDSLAQALWVDGICDEFEAAWLAGRNPTVEEFLARADEERRTALARELIPLDLHHRQKRSPEAVSPLTRDVPTEVSGAARPDASERCAVLDFGTHEVLQEIARGGMGIVFKGRDKQLWRDVAVKVLLDHHLGDAELIKRFVEEARISGQLQHPGIAPVYELGEFADGRPYFTMKLVKGETLAQLLGARVSAQADRERFLRIFEQVCQTLAYAHSRGVIHRDLKPSNIMVGAFGEVQVMDWGLAKVLAESETRRPSVPLTDVSVIRTGRNGEFGGPGSSSQTLFGSVLGTLAYMPPEQALGETDRLDQRADVFGLGAILCEILTGRPPYSAANPEQLRRKAARADLNEAFELLAHCGADEELTRLTCRALAAEPDDRPTDAGVLAAELIGYREGVETRLHQAELAQAQAVTRAIEEGSRRRLALAFSGGLLAVLAIGIIGTIWGLVRAEKALRTESVAKESLRRELYVADLQLADQMWANETGTLKNVAALLAGQIPSKGQTDLREFAWRLQWTELNRNALVLKGHDRGAQLVAFLDGQLVTVDRGPTLRRWKLPQGTLLPETRLPRLEHATCWAMSANGQKIALGEDDAIYLFDVQTEESKPPLRGEVLVRRVSLSADGRHLAGVFSNGRVQIWDLTGSSEPVSSTLQHPEQVPSLDRIELAPDGQHLYVLDYPQNNQITDLIPGESETLISAGHESSVHSMAISRDGKWRATGDANGQVYLSDQAAVGPQDPPLRAHRGSVLSLAFSENGEQLATGGVDGTITVWDVSSRQKVHSLKGHLGRIQSLRFSPDGRTLASGSEDGNARVWDLGSDRTSRILEARGQPVLSVACSPDGECVAVGTGCGSESRMAEVQIWSARSGQLLRTFDAADGRVLALAYSPDGNQLITGGYDSHVRIWDAKTGRSLHELPGLTDPPRYFRQSAVGCLAISPDGKLVAAGFGHPTYHQPDYQQVAKVWDLTTGDEVATLRGHFNTICDLAFSGDGKLLATASDDHEVRLWSVANWQVVRSLESTEQFQSVVFSPDGKWILGGTPSGVVMIWETASGQLVHQLRGHAGAVQRMAFSPDGRTLATASWDNHIKLWDPVSGREIRTLRGHDNWISCLAFFRDGNTLAIGSFDGRVRLWEAASEQEINNAIAEDKKADDDLESRRRKQRQERHKRLIEPKLLSTLNRYAGSYTHNITVKCDDDHLLVGPLSGARGVLVPFHPASETNFFCREREIDLRFILSSEGDPIGMFIYQDGDAVQVMKLSPAGDGEPDR